MLQEGHGSLPKDTSSTVAKQAGIQEEESSMAEKTEAKSKNGAAEVDRICERKRRR